MSEKASDREARGGLAGGRIALGCTVGAVVLVLAFYALRVVLAR